MMWSEVNLLRDLVVLYPLLEVCERQVDVMKEERMIFQQDLMIGSTWWIEEMEQVMKKDYKVIEEPAVSACTFDSVLNNSHSVA